MKVIVKVLSSLFEKSFSISLVWLSAHCGIPGNKQADHLAKRRAAEGSLFVVAGARNRTYPIPIPCLESIPKPIPLLESIPIPKSTPEPIP